MQGTFAQFRARYILLDLILVTIVTIILSILLALISAVTGLNIKVDEPIALYSFYCLFMSAICFTTFLRLKKCGIRLKQIVGTISLPSQPWLMLFIVFYGELSLQTGISQVTIFFSYLIFPNLTKSAIENASFAHTSDTESLPLRVLFFILLPLSLVIVAPITEEFLFRGVLLHRFAAKWGVTWAVLISSVFFGLAHLNIHSISLAVSSIVTALIYLKTRMLIVPVIFHAMNNLIALVSKIIYEISYPNNQIEVTLSTLWRGLLYTVFALPILFYFFKWPSHSEPLPYTANSDSQREL